MDAQTQSAEGSALFDHWLRDFAARLPAASREDWAAVLQALAREPARVREVQERYYRLHSELWSQLLAGDAVPPHAITPTRSDRRFEHPDWDTVPWFRLLKQTYLINTRWLSELLELAELPPARKQRVAFVLKQFLDAAAPSNLAATNPEAIRLALQTRGASLLEGAHRLRRDLARGRIEMSDERAFEVGRTLAITPGAVVYRSALVELIQYTPSTEQVHARPLFIVPPFINKYYVLDLRPDNSLVRYALREGVQVFIVSWRNAGTELGGLTWDDYIEQGVLAPLKVIASITRADRINTLGFCVGGTLLASALAVATPQMEVSSLTLLATMLDFCDVGDIGVYIDETFVDDAEQAFRDGGVMPGSALAAAFASLRANDLVWSFVVNNYLKGKAPSAFDLLYWNGDSANLPGRLYAWYLRHAYLENSLREPGKLEVCGQPLDLRRVNVPTMMLATREDHIVPWRSAYASTRLLAGRIEFVLGASGHIAGIVNPPDANRREFWINPSLPDAADEWLAQARRVPGSWWQHWMQWLKCWSGPSAGAPQMPGNAQYPPLGLAPGNYVREPAQ